MTWPHGNNCACLQIKFLWPIEVTALSHPEKSASHWGNFLDGFDWQ
jgi:hypothetical protein